MTVQASDFQVTPEYVANAAVSCQTTADEIQEQLATLQAYIQQMEDIWQGIAANTFQDLMLQYSTFATMLYNALTDIGQGLQGNYVNYTGAEQANLNTIVSIEQGLQGTNFT
jgi:WXG100 family type VII secretion target